MRVFRRGGISFRGGSEWAPLIDAGVVERQAESFPVRAMRDIGKYAGAETHDLAPW